MDEFWEERTHQAPRVPGPPWSETRRGVCRSFISPTFSWSSLRTCNNQL